MEKVTKALSEVTGTQGDTQTQSVSVQDQLKEYNYYYRQKEYNVVGFAAFQF